MFSFLGLVLFINSVFCDNYYNVSIIHFNDFHARFQSITNLSTTCTEQNCIGGFSRLYYAINKLMKEKHNPVLLNAGDNYVGTIWYNVHKWNVTQHFLNKLPLDAMTLGNHEFDDGISGLTPFLNSVNFPVIVSNIDDQKEPTIQNLYKKSIITEKAGKKIGIIGALTTTTDQVSHSENLIFNNASESVNDEAKKLEQDVFTNIVLSHCGYEADVEIARKSTSKISLIVGGHTHTFLYTGSPVPGPDTPSGPYPTVVLNQDGKTVLIVQASAYTKYLGDLTVFYDSSGNITKWEGSPIFLDNSIPTDPNIDEDLKEWKKSVDAEGEKIVGETVFEMPNSPCRFEECVIGNFATDAMRQYYLNATGEKSEVVALIHAGGTRAGIEKGNITVNKLVSTFPFQDMIDSFDIQGVHLKDIFESHMDDAHVKSPNLFQVSGIRVIFNISNPEGQRVQSLQILGNCEHYEDICLDKDYRILLPTFLSTSDFNPLFKRYLKNKVVGEQDLKVYEDYLQQNWPLAQQLEERIQIVT